jgi:hypothetical protein
MIEPIRPEEVAQRRLALVPEEVIEAFNDLIALKFDGTSATFRQEEAVEAIQVRLSISREGVFERQLLDVGPVYRAAGWRVTYDRPGLQDRSGFFTFERAVRVSEQ